MCDRIFSDEFLQYHCVESTFDAVIAKTTVYVGGLYYRAVQVKLLLLWCM